MILDSRSSSESSVSSLDSCWPGEGLRARAATAMSLVLGGDVASEELVDYVREALFVANSIMQEAENK